MRAFQTAVEAELAPGATRTSIDSPLPPIETTLDGRPLILKGLDSSVIAMGMFAVSSGSSSESIATLINIFFSMLDDEEEEKHYKRRLFNRHDPFDVAIITDIIREAFAEWSANPTQPPSDSSSSPASTGPSSTGSAPSAASPAPSAFGSTVSAT